VTYQAIANRGEARQSKCCVVWQTPRYGKLHCSTELHLQCRVLAVRDTMRSLFSATRQLDAKSGECVQVFVLHMMRMEPFARRAKSLRLQSTAAFRIAGTTEKGLSCLAIGSLNHL